MMLTAGGDGDPRAGTRRLAGKWDALARISTPPPLRTGGGKMGCAVRASVPPRALAG